MDIKRTLSLAAAGLLALAGAAEAQHRHHGSHGYGHSAYQLTIPGPLSASIGSSLRVRPQLTRHGRLARFDAADYLVSAGGGLRIEKRGSELLITGRQIGRHTLRIAHKRAFYLRASAQVEIRQRHRQRLDHIVLRDRSSGRALGEGVLRLRVGQRLAISAEGHDRHDRVVRLRSPEARLSSHRAGSIARDDPGFILTAGRHACGMTVHTLVISQRQRDGRLISARLRFKVTAPAIDHIAVSQVLPCGRRVAIEGASLRIARGQRVVLEAKGHTVDERPLPIQGRFELQRSWGGARILASNGQRVTIDSGLRRGEQTLTIRDAASGVATRLRLVVR